MVSHETRMPPSRVSPALSLLHGDSSAVLLYFLHHADGLGVTDQYARWRCRLDNSASSRNILRNLDAFGQTAVVARYSSVNEARTAMQEGKIYGFFYIPKGMSADAQSQRQPKLSFYTNNSYLIAGSLLFKDMKMMSELASGAAARSVLYAKEQRKIRRWDIYNPLSSIHIRYKILG